MRQGAEFCVISIPRADVQEAGGWNFVDDRVFCKIDKIELDCLGSEMDISLRSVCKLGQNYGLV